MALRSIASLHCMLLALLALAGCATTRTAGEAAAVAPVILVSIDGFAPSYLERGLTPNLSGLADRGVKGEGMRPSFPSVTFPNHYTLVTGLRPDRHGIVANRMEDPAVSSAPFTLGDRNAVGDRRWWDGAEPIWVTAEKRGLRTATMFWPGSEAAIGGVRPTRWLPFDGKMPAEARVDTLLAWLDADAAERPAFMTLYFDDVDHAGHEGGPYAPETARAVARVDAAVGRLLAGLKARGLEANVIVVSDHGMAATSADRVIRLDRIAPPSSYRTVAVGPFAAIEAQPGQEKALARALLQPHTRMECWRKQDIPARFHYGRNQRVPAFLCLADDGWLIASGEGRDYRPGGAHGYDTDSAEMRAIFLAEGPAFEPGSTLPTFDNVDVYPLVMGLLGLRPLASDGSAVLFEKVARRGSRHGQGGTGK